VGYNGENPVAFQKQSDGIFTFTMPDDDVVLIAQFIQVAATLAVGGNIQYFETLEAAFDEVGSGVVATITVLKNVTVQNEITGNGNVTLVAADGPVITVKRGSSEGSLFTVSGTGASLVLNAGNGSLTLDGNDISTGSPLVEVSGGKLTMGDGVTLRNNNNSDNSGGVRVTNSGTFTMTGGSISGNRANFDSGGVRVDGGIFTMTGGTINGNTANSNGGGVLVKNSTFTMAGGTISGNTAESKGGGVYVFGSSTFTMTGGTISGNNLADNGSGDGGGVFVDSTFTMSGTAVVKQDNDVYLPNGKKITVSGALTPPQGETYSAKIKLAAPTNGAVVLEGVGYTLTDGDVKKFTLSGNEDTFLLHNNKGILADTTGQTAADALYFVGDTPTYAATLATAISSIGTGTTATVYIVQDEITVASNINVSGNVTLAVLGDGEKTVERGSGNSGSLFTVGTGASLTLDAGNGSLTLDGGKNDSISADAALVKVVSGGKLTMDDGVTLQNNNNTVGTGGCGGVYVDGNGEFTMKGGTISHNTVSGTGDGGGVYVTGSSTFTMEGGEISDNTASSEGGGLYLSTGSTFTMSGNAVISDNTATSGGGVYVTNGGTFTMSGGTVISDNTATNGGGIYVTGGGMFVMNGGEISSNEVTDDDSLGGGVYVEGGGFTMSGGTICNNTASGVGGGGVFLQSGGTFTMSGGTISGNTAPAVGGGGVYVNNGSTFTMNSGTIRDNSTTGDGGGVCEVSGTFTMNHGTISGTTADENGDNVFSGGTSTDDAVIKP
jgi:parallel beta-helix repeat protein